jgi:leucyl-tRNA synthetase
MEYKHREIEAKWQQFWRENKTFRAENDSAKPKYYVLDMFPYPSGAGLHVGHPLGYIASDIYSRYKRHKGFNVLHPMGYDAYGLPAEQHAIETGQHPADTTERNILRYRQQLDNIGFSFDWDREVRTCDPFYYKWTQWTFLRLFGSWYNKKTNKAEKLESLIAHFSRHGSDGLEAATSPHEPFSAAQWQSMAEKEQQQMLMHYRLAYISETWVNWCPALGTVLANDEVKDGFSERGGHPVERKRMKQWSLRISAYAQRLLDGLNKIDWSESVTEIQRNWIGRSEGASVFFQLKDHPHRVEVFTTRPDTLYGSTFMVLAPEHELISEICSPEQRREVEEYVQWAKNRSERDRQTEVKKVTGVFTGAYAINPLNNELMPVWTADYVLAGYGTGAIMAVPAHDSRDFLFAKHFKLPIIQVVCEPGQEPGDPSTWDESYDSKDGIAINSELINGMSTKVAIPHIIQYIEGHGIGKGRVNFRLRDAIFSRQRYWGEPFPIYYKDGMPYALDESELPLELPGVDKYLPTEQGEPPLARAKNWVNREGYPLETNTMPGFAGSSGYYLRYMDPRNEKAYFSKESNAYWQDVDLYLGGDEHATGHLIYARFWNMFLYDIGLACKEEPFRKLINQGKIQGRSSFVYRINGTNTFVSHNLRHNHPHNRMNVDINIVHHDTLDLEAFRSWRPEFSDAEFILEDGKYHCGWEVEKMSKSKHNVQNPDDLIEHYGADTLRMYEMFLGPLEAHKPWDTNGIEGVYRFFRKLWRLYHSGPDGTFHLSDEAPNADELRSLHGVIKKVEDDILRFSFNTSVSHFMICVNELGELRCNKRSILEPLLILIAPFAPHVAEELWSLAGNSGSIEFVDYPSFNEEYLKVDVFEYPVSFNGKLRFKIELPLSLSEAEIEQVVIGSESAAKWLEGKAPRKVVVVKGRIVNVVV